MERKIIYTGDGSTTIYLPELNESYHSKHGALQEAMHVFIKNGFLEVKTDYVNILEIGFGTGLNCFMTYLENIKELKKIKYVGVEAYPISSGEIGMLNYSNLLTKEGNKIFEKIHNVNWDVQNTISNNFTLLKRKQFIQDVADEDIFDLIYFDAFGYRVQPELWSEEIFSKMYRALKRNGILVTYACRTSIKNAMIQAGFKVEKLPGAPGKREMLRAIKC